MQQILRPVYVLVGPRPMTDRARDLIEEHIAPPGKKGAVIERVRIADDSRPERALELLRELSMFSPRRYVELRGFEDARAELCHQVLDYLPAPEATSTLVVTATSLPRAAPQGKIQKALGKAGLWIDFKDTHPGGFAIAVARANGSELSPELAQRLVEAVGTDLGVLEQETIKLATYMGGAPIDSDAIEAVCPVLAEPIVWQLSDGLAKTDVDAVLEVAQRIGGTTGGAIQLTGVAGMALRRALERDEGLDVAAELRRLASVTRQAREESSDAVNALHAYLLERLTLPR